MRTGFTPWTEVVLAQILSYQRVAAFVLVNIEREHRLNLEAFSRHWLRGYTTWPISRSLGGSGSSTRLTPQSPSSPLAASSQGRKP